MHLAMLLQMAADGMGDRVAMGSRLRRHAPWPSWPLRARRAGTVFAGAPGERVALVDLNSEAVPDRAVRRRRWPASRSCRSTTASPTSSSGTSCAAPRRPR